MTQDLGGKSALVCGSTQGIGRACARALAQRGASVTVVGRHEEGLQQVLGELERAPGAAHAMMRVDFADWTKVREEIEALVRRPSTFHILINNTGGPAAGAAIDARPEEFLAAFQQHVLCNQVLTQACAPGMRTAGYGRIVNIISTSVVTPIKGLGVSNTIRAAVANWARTLAHELAPFGITVNNVLPGFTKTARLDALFKGRASRGGTTVEEVEQEALRSIPARRLAGAEEIASVVGFLASPEAGYVNGVNLPVDGGRLAWQ
jgi:3-oxoacyl-[acyl-carrier protein] reductase